jgi:hypothetical protein
MWCVCIFLFHRESPDLILVDKPLISEVVLSHTCGAAAEDSAWRARAAGSGTFCRCGQSALMSSDAVGQASSIEVLQRSTGGGAARGGIAVARAAQPAGIWPGTFGNGRRSAPAADGSSEVARRAAVEFVYFLCSQLFHGCFIAHEIIYSYFMGAL